jgi:hypothetical protein
MQRDGFSKTVLAILVILCAWLIGYVWLDTHNPTVPALYAAAPLLAIFAIGTLGGILEISSSVVKRRRL